MFVKKKIGAIAFSLMSPQMIRKLSTVEMTVSELYDQDGFPVEGGLMDPRMGVVDPGLRCRACAGRIGECPGHFGFVELGRPVIHVRYADTIYKILKAICQDCSRLLLSEDMRAKFERETKKIKKEHSDLEGWNFVTSAYSAASKIKQCPHCGAKMQEIKMEKPTGYFKGSDRLTPIDVRDMLERIPNEDLPFLGLNPAIARPEWMVITALPAPPVTVRPSITLETGERAEDDLTHKLVDIMRINMRLKENMSAGAPAVIIEDLWELLQYHVTTFIDNEITSIPPARHRAGRVLKGIAQRIKSKEGRFRHNLAGKRVNFCARTVISPDSRIKVSEVGVPHEVALELTVPEVVTDRNADWLKNIILKGNTGLIGANYIIMPDGRRKRVTEDDKEQLAEELKPGVVVERHLMDGDTVLFNRQPSLHRLSIMSHKVRVLPYHSFRINPSICPPYNADFDGDEMNLHVPQTHEARVEADVLMQVANQIRSPRFGGPIVGGHQDHITALYVLTRKDTVLTKEDASQLLFDAGLDLDIDSDKITGKELFTMILPEVTTSFKSRSCKTFGCANCVKGRCEHDAYVVIERGKLKGGVIDETAIGAFEGKLLDVIIRDHGSAVALDFIDKFTKIGLAYFRSRSFSVGIDDFKISESAMSAVTQILADGEAESLRLIEEYKSGKLELWPGMTLRQTLEMEIMAALNRARDKAVEIVRQYVKIDNPAIIMAMCGARGKVLNVAQMAACLGQQAISGGRVRRGYFERTLPHFKRGDVGARSRGFVVNSYGSGLDPFEFYWVAMAGREGLTDTSMRTPKSGYMYRRLANALQDLYVGYDNTVRDNRNMVIQFTYGEDGIDPSKSDWGTIDLKAMMRK